jgi:hypothetical protein
LRLDLDDKYVLEDGEHVRSALHLGTSDSSQPLEFAHHASLTWLRIFAVVEGFVSKDHDEYGREAVESRENTKISSPVDSCD